MAKFIFFMSILLFLLVGTYALFFMELKPKRQEAPADTQNDFNSLIAKDDFRIRSIISRVASNCASEDKECVTVENYRYIVNNFLLNEKLKNPTSALSVLNSKEGNALGLSILLASFLENSNVASGIIFENNKPLTYACSLDINLLHALILKEIRAKPLAKRELTMKKGQVWAVDLSSGAQKPMVIDVEAAADKAFDMLLFENMAEAKQYLKGYGAIPTESCSAENIDNVSITCVASEKAVLVFISKEDDNNLSGAVYKGGVLISDIEERRILGMSCIPMDVSLGGEFLFPGILK